jgi:hypothetical protein
MNIQPKKASMWAGLGNDVQQDDSVQLEPCLRWQFAGLAVPGLHRQELSLKRDSATNIGDKAP